MKIQHDFDKIYSKLLDPLQINIRSEFMSLNIDANKIRKELFSNTYNNIVGFADSLDDSIDIHF